MGKFYIKQIEIFLLMILLPIIFISCGNKQESSVLNNSTIDNSTKNDSINSTIENKLYINTTKANSTIQNNLLKKLPLEGAKIGIDPGHQEKQDLSLENVSPNSKEMKAKMVIGTVGVATGIPEYVLNLKVSLLLKEYLVEQGATVIMTRESNDIIITNIERAKIMNENSVDLCIRIHANGSEDSNVRGASMHVPSGEACINIEDESLAAGEIIYQSFLKETGAIEEGIFFREDLTGFNWSKVPVCLIEMGYMTNPDEDLLLNSESFQEKCARGLCDGIVEWYKNKI